MISERDIIFVTKKQASVTVAVLVVFCLLVFMLGYFWGKQSVLDSFGQRIVKESISDQVDYLSIMQSFAQKTNYELSLSELESPQVKNLLQESFDKFEQDASNDKDTVSSVKSNKEDLSKKKYRAVLLGFGTKPAALSFVNRLKKQNITVEIRPRTSKSASGKTKKTWYQIITKSYDSDDEVRHIIDKIKKFERIKDSDIKIV